MVKDLGLLALQVEGNSSMVLEPLLPLCDDWTGRSADRGRLPRETMPQGS